MPWLENPRYITARERLINDLSSPRYRFRRLAPVIFLCGGSDSPARDAPARDVLRDYLHKHHPGIRLFYAERVWDYIASAEGRSALQMEEELALLADLVIVIVESPGTFAELGAFSISCPLRTKLLPVVDKRYQNQPSFIATGPLRWIDAESRFKPTVYGSLNKILEIVDQIEERISRIQKPKTAKLSDLAESPKHLLFFLCDLVAVIYPATTKMVEYYLGRIAPSTQSSNINVPTLLGLAVALGLLRKHAMSAAGGPSPTFLFPAADNAVAHPFHHKPLLDLPSQRAEHVSVLLKIPAAKLALEELRGENDDYRTNGEFSRTAD